VRYSLKDALLGSRPLQRGPIHKKFLKFNPGTKFIRAIQGTASFQPRTCNNENTVSQPRRIPKTSPDERRRRAGQAWRSRVNGDDRRDRRWVTGAVLRRTFNISAVTLWRWRRRNGFPGGKCINGRLYFPWHQVEAWMEAQRDVA